MKNTIFCSFFRCFRELSRIFAQCSPHTHSLDINDNIMRYTSSCLIEKLYWPNLTETYSCIFAPRRTFHNKITWMSWCPFDMFEQQKGQSHVNPPVYWTKSCHWKPGWLPTLDSQHFPNFTCPFHNHKSCCFHVALTALSSMAPHSLKQM